MSKKEFLIKVLEYIWDSWKVGNALLVLLKNDEFNDEMMTKLINLLEDSLKSVENEQDRIKMEKWIKLLKERENDDQRSVEKDLTAIESLLEDI